MLLPLFCFSQEFGLKSKDEKKDKQLEITFPFSTGVSFFGNSTKTHMDFGIRCVFSSDTTLIDGIKRSGIGFSGSLIFDSNSTQEFRAYGDISFWNIELFFESEESVTLLNFGFLLHDDNNLFYDKAFRILVSQQVTNGLFASGGWYLDRDIKPHKNTRHDLPIFGLSYHF